MTITFRKEVGISNPTEGGAHSWTVHTDKNPTPQMANHPDEDVRRAFRDGSGEGADTGLLVDWEIQLTHETPGRTQEVTAIGRGYKNGTTLTFWRDANFDGVRDTGEEELCRTLVDGNDIGYCSFTVYKPPFVQGSGKCDTVMGMGAREAAETADCNFINAVDGRNNSSTWVRGRRRI